MTWDEFMAARRLLSEEAVGTRQRAEQAAELAQVEATREAIRRHEGL